MKVHTKNIFKSTLVAAVGALVASSAPAFAATLTNGDFELGTITAPSGLQVVAPGDSTTVTGWTGIAGNQGGGALYQENTRFKNNGALSRTVQLNAGGTQGGISTDLTGLIKGETVNVSFQLSGNIGTPPVKPIVSVSLFNAGSAQFFCLGGFPNCQNPTVIGPLVLPVNLAFQTFVASFVYTGESSTANLSFTSQSGNGIGPIIDNVSLIPVPFEFSPLTGFIASGVLFGSYKLIRRKKSVA